MKLITKDILADVYDYLAIGKTYRIKMVEIREPIIGFWNRVGHFGAKEFVRVELWAEEAAADES